VDDPTNLQRNAFGESNARIGTVPDSLAYPLTLRLFGPMEVRVNGAPLPRLRSRKGFFVLALLALRHGADVQRDWVGGTLWPESDEPQMLASLRKTLTDLRAALGAEARRLRSPTPRTLCLDLSCAEVDALAFDQAIARGDVASLERAVALYRGPLLEGCVEEWALQEREVRQQAYLQALETLAALALAGGDPGGAERHLRRAVAVDPLRESAERALMQALALGGNYAAALLVYRELRLLLHRELNAEPDAATTALFQQLRAAAREKAAAGKVKGLPATLDPLERGLPPCLRPESPLRRSLEAVPNNLPLPLTSFIGREDQMAEIEQWLAAYRLVTLTGSGGCGKTRLALEVATLVLEAYPAGAWFIELASLADPALVPQTVATALGVRESPGHPLTETLGEYLRPRQVLLVLDNCEHLLGACARLAEALLRRCPKLRILTTSREALASAGEMAYRVPSLSLPLSVESGTLSVERPTLAAPSDLSTPNPQPPTLMQYEAVRLFLERATAARPAFRLTEANAPVVAEVCRRLDGLPLAIELAAARVKVLSVEQIAARMEDLFRLLTGGRRAALPHQQTLRATLDWSYALLSEPERTLLGRLSVFAGGWTLGAAEAVGAEESVEGWEVLDLLTSLVDKSLAVYDDQSGEGRYRLLETVRQYARDRLLEAGEVEAVRSRHLGFFLRMAEETEPELYGPEQAAWLERLGREHDNLRAALVWSGAQGQEEAGLRLCGALGRFWEVRGYLGEGREHLAGLLALPGAEGRTSARAKALFWAGLLAWAQGEYGAARALTEESLAIRRELGNKQDIAWSLHYLGHVVHHQREYGAARVPLEESLAISRDIGFTLGIAWSLASLGSVALKQGEYGTARAHFEESLAIFRELGDKRGIAESLNHLGMAAHDQGDFGAARALSEESLAIFRELVDKPGIAWSLFCLGHLAHAQGEYGAARVLLEESLAIRRELGNKQGNAQLLTGLGSVVLSQGEYGAARVLLEESLAICRELGNKDGIAYSLLSLGWTAHGRGEYGTARAFFAESLAVWQELGNKQGIAKDLEGLAAVAVAQAHSERAARLLGAAEGLREAMGAPLPPADRGEHDRCVAAVRTALGEEGVAAVWAEGRAMSLEAAVAHAMENADCRPAADPLPEVQRRESEDVRSSPPSARCRMPGEANA
jgi:predicted ATPase/DNA-binding SARP family transcriptional activator